MAETAPLAFFITFRTYGTWLPGDERGAIDQERNSYGDPREPRDDFRKVAMTRLLKSPAVTLDPARRACVENAMVRVVDARGWTLLASNVRSNHVHLVVQAGDAVESVMQAFKAHATRSLREAGLVEPGARVWARHGSTRWLWTQASIEETTNYVLFEQGD